MLVHPVIEKLQSLRLYTMAKTLKEQQSLTASSSLSFEERLALLVDMEMTARENRRLQTRLKKAKLKHNACVEDIDYQTPRGLDKSWLETLSYCQWVQTHHNILIVGPCGAGKTFLACALAHKSCLLGYSSQYERLSRLLADLQLFKGDGQYQKKMNDLAKVDVLILDDFGLYPFSEENRRDLLELLDDRHEKHSTIITSQLPIKLWHETLGNGMLADAILDRLVHNGYRVEMIGEDSMRKIKSKLNKTNKTC
jgi:DNA replication protein DnaC